MNKYALEMQAIQSLININESNIFYASILEDDIILEGFNDIAESIKDWFIEILHRIKNTFLKFWIWITGTKDSLFNEPAIVSINTWISKNESGVREAYNKFISIQKHQTTVDIIKFTKIKDKILENNKLFLNNIKNIVVSKNQIEYYKPFYKNDFLRIDRFKDDVIGFIASLEQIVSNKTIINEQLCVMMGTIYNDVFSTLMEAITRSRYTERNNFDSIPIDSISIDSLLKFE